MKNYSLNQVSQNYKHILHMILQLTCLPKYQEKGGGETKTLN